MENSIAHRGTIEATLISLNSNPNIDCSIFFEFTFTQFSHTAVWFDPQVKEEPRKSYEEILEDPVLSAEEKGRECLDLYLAKDSSLVTDLFLGQFRSTLKCCECHHESVTFEPFWVISVPIPKEGESASSVTLNDCLNEFVKVETLDEDERPTCEKCKDRRKSWKWYSVERWPDILVIHLKRFAPSGSYRSKLTGKIGVPLRNMDLRYNSNG